MTSSKPTTSGRALACLMVGLWAAVAHATTTTTTLPVGPDCVQSNQLVCGRGAYEAVGPLTVDGATPYCMQGATQDAFSTCLVPADPTGNRSVIIPDATSVTVRPNACSAGQVVNNVDISGVLQCAVPSDLNCSACVDASDIGVLSGATPLVFEGATPDAFETTLTVTDPTADHTFTIPNADSVAVQPQTCAGGQTVTAISALGAVTCASVSSTDWNAITTPTGNLLLSHGNRQTTFTWGNATGANPMWKITDTASNTGTGAILKLTKATGSAAHEFEIENAAADSRIVGNAGFLHPDGFGLIAATQLHTDVSTAVLSLANGLNDPITLTVSGGTQLYNFYKITGPTGAFTIGGTNEVPEHGALLVLYNTTAQNMTIKHNNGVGSEFWFLNGADHTTTGEGTMTFIYDGALTRWIEIAEQL